MAIYSAVPPPSDFAPVHDARQTPTSSPAAQRSQQAHSQAQSTPQSQQQTGVEIDAWTIAALQSLSVSPVARGIGSPLTIPIDEKATVVRAVTFGQAADAPPRRPPSRRDSQVRREALLKGKEGSRARRRWENNRFMGVPNAQPPEPHDWEVHPTHPIQRVPYALAQFWDRGVRERVVDNTSRLQSARKKQQLASGSATGLGVGEVPRDLREAAKRSPVVKGWARGLEEPVRRYLISVRQPGRREDRAVADSSDSAVSDGDSEDEEIVFVGRRGAMQEMRKKKEEGWRRARREIEHETVDSGIVFDSFGDDETAAMKRWLVHTISDYYGLQSRSVTLTKPAQRVVYVGLKTVGVRNTAHSDHLPKPIWELC